MQLPDGIKMTPMLKQFTHWKDRYPDCLLLFRMGDFFETFFDDAVTAAEVLDITLTARDQDKSIPMAGVPHHALDAYMGKLIAAGFKVAVCDQITEPDGKTLVERSVVRVVTPGTYVPEEAVYSGRGARSTDGRLASFLVNGDLASIALLSSGTGTLQAGTFAVDEALSYLFSYEPGEILLPKGQAKDFENLAANYIIVLDRRPMIVERERGEFNTATSNDWLCRRWQIASLRVMGIEDSDPAGAAAAAALRYLEETQFGASQHVNEVEVIKPKGLLVLDQTTQLNLELTSGMGMTLFDVLNDCRTPMGKRLLNDWIIHPLTDLEIIDFRQNCIEYLTNDSKLLKELYAALSKCRDMERAVGRLALHVGNPRDAGVVRDTLCALPAVVSLVLSADCLPLKSIFDGMPDVGDLTDRLAKTLADDLPRSLGGGQAIRRGYDAVLDEHRNAIEFAGDNLRQFEQRERERTGIKIKVGINKVFGYFIEVSKSYLDRVPDNYVRRQTIANGERFVTEELKEIERRAFRAEQQISAREDTLYKELLNDLLARSGDIQKICRLLALLDVLRSLASVARDHNYVRPLMDDSRVFDVRGARHPIIERTFTNIPFTPNDIDLDPDTDKNPGCIAIITGPNMAGKSTYLRTAALVALIAHIGSFIPATSAHIGLIDRIFTRIGARDELLKGRSTFMVEMLETANILRHVTARSLVILDEIGRGTSTYDGMSIAWAIVEFLALHVEGRTKALFATHYHELTNMTLPSLINLSMAVEETHDGIRFLHRVVKQPADRSYGIEVARLAGVPNMVIRRSQELLSEFENDTAKSRDSLANISQKNVQKEIFFDVEREGVMEQLALANPNQMTPMEALDLVFKLRETCRKILGYTDGKE